MARKTTNGIDVDRLNQEIEDLGIRVKLYRSTVCPNMKSLESNDHDINCQICNNMMIDFAPRETIAMFQQQTLMEHFKIAGTFHIDEILVSFMSDVTLHTFTRVDLLDFKEDFFELIQRQEGTDTDKLKYSACSVIGLFAAVDSSTREEYHYGTDFTIDQDGNIKWTSTHRPADRKIYSIYYQYHPIFRAIKAAHRDRYSQYNLRPGSIKAPKKTVDGKTFVKLPETWILKRDYLVKRPGQGENEFYDPNE